MKKSYESYEKNLIVVQCLAILIKNISWLKQNLAIKKSQQNFKMFRIIVISHLKKDLIACVGH